MILGSLCIHRKLKNLGRLPDDGGEMSQRFNSKRGIIKTANSYDGFFQHQAGNYNRVTGITGKRRAAGAGGGVFVLVVFFFRAGMLFCRTGSFFYTTNLRRVAGNARQHQHVSCK